MGDLKVTKHDFCHFMCTPFVCKGWWLVVSVTGVGGREGKQNYNRFALTNGVCDFWSF